VIQKIVWNAIAENKITMLEKQLTRMENQYQIILSQKNKLHDQLILTHTTENEKV